MTYEQIKKIAVHFYFYATSIKIEDDFDEWASGPGKDLMEKEMATPNTDKLDKIRKQVEAAELLREGQTQAIKNSTAIFAYGNIAKIVTGVNPLVSQPSNSAPVSPDKQKCPICDKAITPDVKCHNCGQGLIEEEPKINRHESLVREIAEEMYVKGKEMEMLDIRPEYHGAKEIAMDSIFIPMARIAVKRMTEEFKAGYEQAASDYGYANAHNDSDINAYLIERGLIPEKEGGSHE